MDLCMSVQGPPKVPQTDAAELPGNPCSAVATHIQEDYRKQKKEMEKDGGGGADMGRWD